MRRNLLSQELVLRLAEWHHRQSSLSDQGRILKELIRFDLVEVLRMSDRFSLL